MAITPRGAALFLGLLLAALPSLEAKKSCKELGFTASLLCSYCNQLADFVPDAELVAECRECCAEDAAPADTQAYVSGSLEFCPHSLRGFPHVETYVMKVAPSVSNLRLRQVMGVRPRLVLKAEDGSRHTVRIDGWKTEHIEEYVREKLPPGGAPGAGAAGKQGSAGGSKGGEEDWADS